MQAHRQERESGLQDSYSILSDQPGGLPWTLSMKLASPSLIVSHSSIPTSCGLETSACALSDSLNLSADGSVQHGFFGPSGIVAFEDGLVCCHVEFPDGIQPCVGFVIICQEGVVDFIQHGIEFVFGSECR
jgi:hypothetical protein